ncbi:hypothetical protein Bca101_098819 [Brassica carinata]
MVVLTIGLHGFAAMSSGSSITLVDFRWFARISRETSLSVKIGGGLSEKLHVSSRVRVLTRGLSGSSLLSLWACPSWTLL